MPDERDPDRGKTKGNTDKELKPRDVARDGVAPRGHLGTAPSLGMGSSNVQRPASESLQRTSKDAGRGERGSTNEKALNFRETGDKEVDRHYSRDHNMKAKDDRDDRTR